MGDPRHTSSCANAIGHRCLCAGCGGSRHGWPGWLSLARETRDVRLSRTAQHEAALNSPSRRPKKAHREACSDLARTNVASWLATQTCSDVAGDNDAPSATNAAIEDVNRLAEALTHEPWNKILQGLSQADSAINIRKELAAHVWCDLIIGLIQVVHDAKSMLDGLSNAARSSIISVVLNSSLQQQRQHIAPELVEVMVGGVCAAFEGFVRAAPGVTPESLLRALRILALFICPAPESHDAVRENALKPLGDDALGILTSETKEYLTRLFAD